MWVFPQKVQAAFSSSCLFRNLWNGPRRIGYLPLCFPLKLFLWSLHLAPRPQFIFYFIFWVAASWKVFVWEGRWEWKRGEVAKPKERREASFFRSELCNALAFYPSPRHSGIPHGVGMELCLCHRLWSEHICVWGNAEQKRAAWLIPFTL